MRAPSLAGRVLLRAFPRWFREEYGAELAGHLAMQRAEPRYSGPLGGARFWFDAGTDALVNGITLRLGRVRERWSARRHEGLEARGGTPAGGGGNEPNRGRLATMFDTIVRDLRHALRGVLRRPGYAAVFVVTLGLGIGANTAMFSIVNGVLLRPLPHEDGDRLVYLRQSAPLAGFENVQFSVPETDDYRQHAPSLDAVAEFSALTFTMLGVDRPRRVRAGIVSGNYFEVLGLRSIRGRTIGRSDDGPGAPPVIVLADSYWRSAFGADADMIGATVDINGLTATIVGVAAPAPPYPEPTDIYVNMAASPHHLDATMTHDRAHRMTEVFARLAPGATVESARAEAAAIAARLHAEYPEAYDAASGYQVAVTPLKAELTTRARPALLLLLGTAFLVLIIACANLANLTLTRVLRREHELTIRVSLGASRAALRRELLVESLLLAVAGAAVGLAMASVSLDLLVAFAERYTTRASEITLDATVFGFALLVAIAASLFFTALPALPAGGDMGGALTRSGSRLTIGRRARRVQRTLVVAQIGTSFVLLIGAGLLLRTMMHLNRVDPGFDTAHVLTMNIPPNALIPTGDDTRNRYMTMLEDVRVLPGVASAALASAVPLTGSADFAIAIAVEGHQPVPGAPAPRAEFRVVSPDYFAAMGVPVVRGREFLNTDVEGAHDVVVINESMARLYFGDDDPVGRRIAWRDEMLSRFMGVGDGWRTVVGVVADTREAGLDVPVQPTVYNAYPQVRLTRSLVVRTYGDAAAVIASIRASILARNPDQPIENVATTAQLVAESVAPRRLNTLLLGSFALLALIIAAVGIGGVLAFSVGSRTREFGVRSALGAAHRQIQFGVLAEGATLAAIGIAIGALTAVAVTRLLAGMLYGVPALDPATFLAVGALLGAVAIAAAWVPAWRAAKVSPMEALSGE